MADEKVVCLLTGLAVDDTAIDLDMIEALEGMLAHAKAGRIKGIAVAVTFRDGATQTAWSDKYESPIRLTGAIAILAHRHAAHVLEIGRD